MVYIFLLISLLIHNVQASQQDTDFPFLEPKKLNFYKQDREQAKDICKSLNSTRQILLNNTSDIDSENLEFCLGNSIIYALCQPDHWLGKGECGTNNQLEAYFHTLLAYLDSDIYIDLEALETNLNRAMYVLVRQKKWKKKSNKEKMRKIGKLSKKVLPDQLQDLLASQIIKGVNNYLKRRTIEDGNTKFIFELLTRDKITLSIFSLKKKLSPWKKSIQHFLEKYETIETWQLKDNLIPKRVTLQSLSISKTQTIQNRHLIRKVRKRSST